MKSMYRSLLALFVAVALLGTATTAQAGDNQRRDWFKKYDENKDQRLKGKEVRHFKQDHLIPFKKLRDWCRDARDKPKKHDVNLPKGVKERKTKCRRRRVDNPYVKAWIADANSAKKKKKSKPGKEEEKKGGSVNREKPASTPPTHPGHPNGSEPEPAENPCNPCAPTPNPCAPEPKQKPVNPCG